MSWIKVNEQLINLSIIKCIRKGNEMGYPSIVYDESDVDSVGTIIPSGFKTEEERDVIFNKIIELLNPRNIDLEAETII